MPGWVLVFIMVAGVLFALKVAMAVAYAWALPVTRGALFVSTPRATVQAFLEQVPMDGQEVLVDLGCGDGRVLRAARRRYNMRAVGFEVNVLAFMSAKLLGLGDRRSSVRFKSFWSADLRDADVIFCYLFPDLMPRLAQKLERELRTGARVVSCNFPIPGWRPRKVLRPSCGRHRDPIFVYSMGQEALRIRRQGERAPGGSLSRVPESEQAKSCKQAGACSRGKTYGR